MSNSRRIITVLGLAGLLACGTEIGEVRVQSTKEDSNEAVLQEVVLGNIRSRVGTEFSPAVASDDLRVLRKSGKLDDVQVATDTTKDGKVIVIFKVTPTPLVRRVLLQGHTAFKTASLTKIIHHQAGVLLDENQLADDRAELLKKYRDSGYYGTEVQTIRSASKDGDGVDVTFVITESLRFKLKKVYFRNNTVFSESELRSAVVTQRQWWRYIFRLGNYFNEQQLVLDKDQLRRLYGQKGYMDFAVSEVLQEKVDNGKWLAVTFVLEEGQPYTIGKISISGNEHFTAEELLAKTVAKEGAVHNSAQEEADLARMKAEYERLGYMDLRFFATHKKDVNAHVVDVEYHVTEGKPSKIRNIDIKGNTTTRDEVIRRELAIYPNDLGDNEKIRLSKSRLMNLGYFSQVDILPVATEIPDMRDLRIELKERGTGMFSVGAAFSSEDSVLGFVEFQETNFDLMRLLGMQWPPRGDGQNLRTRVAVGSETSNISISHTEPWFLDRRLELTTDFFLRNRYEDEYDQRNIGAGMMLSCPLKFRLLGSEHVEEWKLGLGFRVEHVKISDVDEHDPSRAMEKGDFVKDHILAEEEDGYMANRLIMRLTRDTRNAVRYPTRGSRVVFQSEYVTEALGSYESYGRFSLGGTKYIPAFRDVILKLDADYNTTTGGDVAIFDRYFGGGIGTVRGFRRRDVAPVDCFEDPLGGNSMLTGSVELIKPIKDFMFTSVFMDAGNAWWDDFEMDLGDLNYSVGVGIQLRSIPISLYYGYPISTTWDHLDGKSGRLHFNIGFTY